MKKPTDLDLHCLQRQEISGTSRIRDNIGDILILRILGNFACFFCRLWIFFFFFKLTYPKKSFRNAIRVSKSLDPDQAQHLVGPDLDPNCLQRSSAGDKSDH